MFGDLDKTLEALLKRELPEAIVAQVGITFAAPDEQFPPSSITLPAIDIFLYDIRENLELRNTEWQLDRRADGTTMRRRSPAQIDCSYLVTAWPSAGTPDAAFDEHQLLGEVLRVLLRFPVVPYALLPSSLRDDDVPLPTFALSQPHLQGPGDFWQAMGNKPKPTLHFTATIGVQAGRQIETEALVVEKEILMDLETRGRKR